MSDKTIQVELKQQQDYRFEIAFGPSEGSLLSDEPAPLGTGQGPSPVHLLCAAVGNCLSDSLLFAFRKFKQAPEPIQCAVTATVGRNTDNKLRVTAMHAQLTLGVDADQLAHVDHVLSQFEQYCTVTQSVGQGIPVSTQVADRSGRQLKFK